MSIAPPAAPEATDDNRLPDAEAESAPRRRLRLRRALPDLLLVSGLLTLIIAIQGWNITNFPGLGDDEGTYLAQAWAVRQGDGLAHYTYWYDHPPAGWIQIAILSWLPPLFGSAPIVGYGRLVMLVVSAVNVVLVYALGRRIGMNRWR